MDTCAMSECADVQNESNLSLLFSPYQFHFLSIFLTMLSSSLKREKSLMRSVLVPVFCIATQKGAPRSLQGVKLEGFKVSSVCRPL